jgi:predicted alpha/beta superfamily hydrolase
MHDGQNLFDPTTSFLGIDWRVDETIDSLIQNNEIQPIIVVGIYNTTDRRKEYSHTNSGKKYMDFIIHKLKPFIDQNYRTYPDRKNSAVGGSSMGGLMSFMLVWEYPNIFSKAICMSPAFKIDSIDYISIVCKTQEIRKNIKIYIDNGGLDLDERLQPGIDEMTEVLKKKGFVPGKDFLWYKDKNAPHNETAWAARFWRPLKYFFKK